MEGSLTLDQERQLEAFLLANPDLPVDPVELDGGEHVEADRVTFEDKASLRRTLPPTGVPTERNIGDFLIALHEGDLTNEQQDALRSFMEAHPQFAREAKLTALARAADESVAFVEKESLVRSFPPQGMPDRHRLDDFLVGRLENDLTLQQRVALEKLLSNDAEASQQWALMSRAVVRRETVVYEDKAGLRKKETRVIPIGGGWMRWAAAASIALVLGLGWLIFKQSVGSDRVGPGLATDRAIAPKQEQLPPVEHDGTAGTDHPAQEKKVPGTLKDEQGVQSSGPSKAEAPDQKNEDNGPAPQRVAPVRRSLDDEPLMAQTQRPSLERDPLQGQPIGVAPATGPLPVPMEEQLAEVPQHLTVGQVITGAVRREVLGRPGGEPHTLDGSDAVAAIDKGLGALSGDRAGLDAQRTAKRSRFRLQLGGVALSASRGR